MYQEPVPVQDIVPSPALISAGAQAAATPTARGATRGRGRGRASGRGRMSLSQPTPELRRLGEEDEDDFDTRRQTKVLPSYTYG